MKRIFVLFLSLFLVSLLVGQAGRVKQLAPGEGSSFVTGTVTPSDTNKLWLDGNEDGIPKLWNPFTGQYDAVKFDYEVDFIKDILDERFPLGSQIVTRGRDGFGQIVYIVEQQVPVGYLIDSITVVPEQGGAYAVQQRKAQPYQVIHRFADHGFSKGSIITSSDGLFSKSNYTRESFLHDCIVIDSISQDYFVAQYTGIVDFYPDSMYSQGVDYYTGNTPGSITATKPDSGFIDYVGVGIDSSRIFLKSINAVYTGIEVAAVAPTQAEYSTLLTTSGRSDFVDKDTKDAGNNLVYSLKSSGLWDSLYVLYIPATTDSLFAAYNWKDPSAYSLQKSGDLAALRWYQDTGFISQGVGANGELYADGLSINELESLGVDTTLSVGWFMDQNENQDGTLYYQSGENGQNDFDYRSLTDAFSVGVLSNQVSVAYDRGQYTRGVYIASRINTSEVSVYTKGDLLQTVSSAYIDRNRTINLLPLDGYNGYLGAFFYGKGISASGVGKITEYLNAYMASIQ